LGTSIVVLPLDLPLRVAEDAAVVDLLSGGRLELGVGSGGEVGEFQAFGLDVSQRRALTSTGMETLQRALRGESLNESGQRLDPPAPTLIDRLWQSALSEVGAHYVAKAGAGLMLSKAAWTNDEPTDVVQLRVAEAYLAGWESQSPPRISLSRGIHLAADRATALVGLSEPVMQSARKLAAKGQSPAGLSLEEHCHRMHIFYGHPQEIAAGLAADRVLPHTQDLILQFSPIIPPFAEAMRMLEQIATEIAPALGWRPQP
jgi:alkanesulfonate monooxygenase SsuD/methylene tetrahydromethanopterin reductase-like flavin-dependent oxidoreductase (luciferase family)